MVKKIYLIILVLLFETKLSFSQSKEALLEKLKTTQEDTAKVNLLNALAKEALSNRATDARLYATQALALAQKINYVNGFAKAYSNAGYCFLNESLFDSALVYFNKGILISEGAKYKHIHAELLNRKGVTFYYKGITDSSLWYFKKSLAQYEALKDSAEIIKALNNIGAISLRAGDMDGALNYFFKCLAYDEKQKSKKFIAMDCDNISVILVDKKDFASAITYSQRALSLKTELKDTGGLLKTYLNIALIYDGKKDYVEGAKQLSVALKLADPIKHINDYAKIINNMGSFYSCLHDYKNATLFLTKSLEIKKQLGDKSGEASTLGNLGGLYYNQHNYSKAAEYYAQSDKIAVETGDLGYQKNAQKTLTECYIRLNKNTNALTSFQKLMLIQDSLYNATSIKQATEIQVKYETEKKEQENKLLQQQNDIKTLENENNQQKLKVRNQTILILIGAFIVALIIVFWQISLARIKKQKRELEIEKKLQQDRERISRDLHDNVGGQLSYVLFSLEANEDVSAEKRKEKATNLSTAIRSVTGNLRETIWALNNEKLSLEKLSDKLKTYTKNMFSYSSTKLKFEENIENDTELNPAFALNLFRICQEVVNNAFKYAHATELKISILKKEKTTITISDNGVGFLEDINNPETFGLTNLKNRALEINADLNITSKPGLGTTVTLIV